MAATNGVRRKKGPVNIYATSDDGLPSRQAQRLCGPLSRMSIPSAQLLGTGHSWFGSMPRFNVLPARTNVNAGARETVVHVLMSRLSRTAGCEATNAA